MCLDLKAEYPCGMQANYIIGCCFKSFGLFQRECAFVSGWEHLKCNCVVKISVDIDNDCNWRNYSHFLSASLLVVDASECSCFIVQLHDGDTARLLH